MESARWLRIAAGLTAFQAAGHTFGAVLAGPSSAEESALRQTMGAFHVSVMGMERSYWDFYFGSGWAITALALTVAAVMWLLAPIARQSPSAARPMILALAVGYAALTVISVLYFITAPIVIGAIITICLVMAAMARSSGATATLLFAVALPATLYAQGGTSPPRVDLTELRTYVERFTSPNPDDCGQHTLSRAVPPAGVQDLQRALACASAAAKDRKPFWTFKQNQGIDSLLFQGLLGTADGIVYRFSYDSAPCGGPGCAGSLTIRRCDKPTVLIGRNGGAEFGCAMIR